jgi:integrase
MILMNRPAKGSSSPPKANTIRSIRNRLHCVSKYLISIGRIDVSPWLNVKGPKHQTTYIAPPTDAQVAEALHVAGTIGKNERIRLRNQAITYFFAFTGVRTIELVRLDRAPFVVNGALPRSFKVLGKGDKERVIGIPPEVTDPLTKYLAARNDLDDALFTDRYGDRIAHTAIRSVMREIRAEINRRGNAPVDSFGAHSLRRWCFSAMVKNGIPTHTIRELGGWSTYTAMEHYTHYGAMEQAAETHANMRLMPSLARTQKMRL